MCENKQTRNQHALLKRNWCTQPILNVGVSSSSFAALTTYLHFLKSFPLLPLSLVLPTSLALSASSSIPYALPPFKRNRNQWGQQKYYFQNLRNIRYEWDPIGGLESALGKYCDGQDCSELLWLESPTAPAEDLEEHHAPSLVCSSLSIPIPDALSSWSGTRGHRPYYTSFALSKDSPLSKRNPQVPL